MKSGLAGLLVLTVVTGAVAANVHYKQQQPPTFEALGEGAMKVCMSLAGLGNQDITVTVALAGEAEVLYWNPGSNLPPGQNQEPVTSVATVSVPREEIKNGNVSLCVETPPVEVAPAPNPNWTVEIADVAYSYAIVTVVQKGKVVFEDVVVLAE